MENNHGINMRQLMLHSIVAALGGLLFGFDIAIITGAGPFFTEAFELNRIEEGWAYSSLLFGCIIGAAIAGRMTDILGRKRILFFVAFLFTLTSVWSAITNSLTELVLARIAGGIAVGGASVVVPMYISEISPSKYRGSLVSMYQLFIVTGILVSYLVNYLLRDLGPNNWRWMFVSGSIPSALFFVMLFFISETPRFLYLKGKRKEALAVLERIGGKKFAGEEFEEIRKSIGGESVSFRMLLDPSIRKLLWVGFGLAVFVQLSGINTIIDYAPKIFATAGMKIDTALFATFGLGIVNFVFTWVSILIIDKFGRRPLYIIGSAGLIVALAGLTIAGLLGHFTGAIVLALIIIFLMFFSACIGPVFWTYMSEIFPTRIRGTAMSIPVFTQWVSNAFIVLIFPLLLHKLEPGITFGILSVFAFGQLLFAVRYMRETKGKSLEEIEDLWK